MMQFLWLATGTLFVLVSRVSGGPASASIAASASSVNDCHEPRLPENDPFYVPPTGFEHEAPGAILRSRAIEHTAFSIIQNPVKAWQLLYRTTAVNGSAIATVTTVFQPPKPRKDQFVSYATAYDSASNKCDPSYTYQRCSNTTINPNTNAEVILIEGYLLQGYTVSSADYEGPEAGFSSGYLEGMGLLDSLRAVSNFEALGFTTKTPAIVGVGYSGGAIASGWAATLHGSYAPELPVKAWVQGGTPVNTTATFLYDANTSNSGYLPATLAGLSKSSTYGAQLSPFFDEILTAKGKAAMEYVSSHCVSEDINEYKFTSPFSYEFQSLGPALLDNTVLGDLFRSTIMGERPELTPMVPILVLHARQDEIIPYVDAASMVKRYCARGADVTFISYGQGGHLSSGLLGFPETYQYVNRAFGNKLGRGCIYRSELNTLLNPIALVAELEPISARLTDLIHKLQTQ